jgi:methyl-accepting chemotaxis protein
LENVGAIRFCDGNYVFVNDLKGKTLMHIKPTLIGKVLIGLKDDTGKRFFADFTEATKTSQATRNGVTYFNGAGWVDYRWPKPGAKDFSALDENGHGLGGHFVALWGQRAVLYLQFEQYCHKG